jgi:hypothetical protein
MNALVDESFLATIHGGAWQFSSRHVGVRIELE